jgi:lysophospholipase L1-like esterase
VTPGLIFPCGPAFAEPDDAERARRQALVPHTLAKLRAGEDVVVCTWGDSVTAGGDAIPVQRAYPWTFTAALRDRYPKARVTLVNAGIGGTSTAGRLPNLQKEVLDFHPDLVTIEFVNDCGLPPDTLRANWRDAIGQIRATGADVIILTPHYVMPPWMGGTYESMWWTDNRAAIQVMREVAQEKGAGIADTTHRWEHLCLEGLPYITLLWNGINHPDNRGHDLFTADLLTFF